MSASGLEQRIAQLEDIEAIKKLKANLLPARLKLGSWFWTAFDQGWAKRRYVMD